MKCAPILDRDGNGAGLGRGSYPPPPPCYPCPIPAPPLSRGNFLPPSLPYRVPTSPQYIYIYIYILFHSFWLNYMKQKNSICMTKIDLQANQFTSINLHETTIYT
jgi:hypothetical protein